MLRHAIPLAIRLLSREWKSGELGVLLMALTIAVGALTGVGFLVNRITQSVKFQANEVLAADLRIEAADRLNEKYLQEAKQRNLVSAATTTVFSVVFREDLSQLTNVRAVSAGYPLRGTLGVATEAFAAPTKVHDVPSQGEVWPDSKLLSALQAKVGDQLSIGATTFKITRILISRPDQGGGFGELAPTLLMNINDLSSTQLIQPGSRASYAFLFAGEQKRIKNFKKWLSAQGKRSERIRDVSDASPQIKSAIDRSAKFLSLASLVAILLSSIAVAMSARRYVIRHLDSVALMKTLGATRAFILTVSMTQLFLVGIAATIIGSILGFLTQQWLLYTLKDLLRADLPAADFLPFWLGFITAVVVLLGFALPHLLQLARVPAMRVLRRDIGEGTSYNWLAFGPAIFTIIFLVYWIAQDTRLFIGFIIGLSIFLIILGLAGVLLVRVVSSFRSAVGISWRYGLANLSRRRNESIIQIISFGLGIMVLLLLGVVRGDLLADWQRSLPINTPNYFFINIPTSEHEEFLTYLKDRGATSSRALPMLRARLIKLNGREVTGLKFTDPRGENFARREQNITWQADLGLDNQLLEGRWWDKEDQGLSLVSVASEFQEAMDLKLGDSMSFDVGGEIFVAKISSFRKIKWDSFQPNFFLVFAPGLLDETAGTWMTSAYFNPANGRVITDLVRRFPSVSVFDLGELLAQVRTVIDKAIFAVQSVFLFTLFAGLVVLLAAIQSTGDQRRYESAMLRTLGASRSVVSRGILAEFATLGMLSGLLAAMGASLAAWLLAQQILQIKYSFNPSVWLIGLVGGGVLVGLSGWLATRSVLQQPPASLLTLNGRH
ncbi:MAG: FtsX-like permease family protein [Gammaproteobacteria bacterium]|nr:FtsX-like permease family protein [Gammaproteobacteria bacterium]